jgi:hypothetical protein
MGGLGRESRTSESGQFLAGVGAAKGARNPFERRAAGASRSNLDPLDRRAGQLGALGESRLRHADSDP